MTNIVVINLDRAVERRKKIEDQLQSQGLMYQMYTGFDAKNLNKTISAKITLGYGTGRNFLPGELGCTLSHIGVITMAKILNWESVTVFEDDIVICKDFNESLNYMCKYLPKDWEHVFLGGYTYNYQPITMPTCIPSPKTSGTYSYMLRNTAYDKSLNMLYTMDTTTDDLFEHMKLKSFIFFPTLTYPLRDYSYVNNEIGHGDHPAKKLWKAY